MREKKWYPDLASDPLLSISYVETLQNVRKKNKEKCIRFITLYKESGTHKTTTFKHDLLVLVPPSAKGHHLHLSELFLLTPKQRSWRSSARPLVCIFWLRIQKHSETVADSSFLTADSSIWYSRSISICNNIRFILISLPPPCYFLKTCDANSGLPSVARAPSRSLAFVARLEEHKPFCRKGEHANSLFCLQTEISCWYRARFSM